MQASVLFFHTREVPVLSLVPLLLSESPTYRKHQISAHPEDQVFPVGQAVSVKVTLRFLFKALFEVETLPYSLQQRSLGKCHISFLALLLLPS